MKRMVWLTDIHLNFLRLHHFDGFFSKILKQQPDLLVISGDISQANTLAQHLKWLEMRVKVPTYFVLGNHDYYRAGFASVQATVAKLCEKSERLVWLNQAGVVTIARGVGLIGHDSWADARMGDYATSEVMLNDYLQIEDFIGLDKEERRRKLNMLGDAAAAYFREMLPRALVNHEHVYVVTHVPPYRESCWHEGEVTSEDFLPHFSCQAVGEVLREIMAARPDRRITVLCGHTHGASYSCVLDNLIVMTGGAEYGKPDVQQVFEIHE